MPKISEFSTTNSDLAFLLAKMQDGRPAFNFTDLGQLWMHLDFEDKQNYRYLLQNAKLLENFHLSVKLFGVHLVVGLHGTLSTLHAL